MCLFSSFFPKQKTEYRSSRSQVFFKLSVLKISQYSHLCWSRFLIKLKACLSVALLKRDSNTGVFQRILKNFQGLFFYRAPLVVVSKYKSQYKKGIGMTKNQILTLPDITYLSRNVIQVPLFNIFTASLTSAYILFANAFSLFSLSLKMHLNKNFTVKSLRTWLREYDSKHNHSYKKIKIFSSDYDATHRRNTPSVLGFDNKPSNCRQHCCFVACANMKMGTDPRLNYSELFRTRTFLNIQNVRIGV